jgi:hypothetical protein
MSPSVTPRALARRRFLGLVLASPILVPLALTACGDDAAESGSPASSGSTLRPADSTPPSTAPTGAISHPTGADDVVLWIGTEGGFVPAEMAFQHLPTLLVSGDGRALAPGVQTEIYPGPLLRNVQQRTISEAGIQELLGLAVEMGLFAPGSYEGPEATIADAPDTVVRLNANGTTIEHRAYALGLDPAAEDGGDRARLAEFVALATDLSSTVGDAELGAEQPYVADTYRIRASVAPDASGLDIEPTVVDWPATASVRLADATECAEVPVDELADVFESATQLTRFRDGDVTYQVTAVPSLPGETC